MGIKHCSGTLINITILEESTFGRMYSCKLCIIIQEVEMCIGIARVGGSCPTNGPYPHYWTPIVIRRKVIFAYYQYNSMHTVVNNNIIMVTTATITNNR